MSIAYKCSVITGSLIYCTGFSMMLLGVFYKVDENVEAYDFFYKIGGGILVCSMATPLLYKCLLPIENFFLSKTKQEPNSENTEINEKTSLQP